MRPSSSIATMASSAESKIARRRASLSRISWVIGRLANCCRLQPWCGLPLVGQVSVLIGNTATQIQCRASMPAHPQLSCSIFGQRSGPTSAGGAARTRLERGLGIGAGIAAHARDDLFLRFVGTDPAGDSHPLAGLEVFVMREKVRD